MTGERIQSQIVGARFMEGLQTNNDFAKIAHDRYEIYVNGDFVGYKTLVNASDTLADVDDFLNEQGVSDFTVKVDGDHYLIETNDAILTKDVLNVYCQNR